MISGNFNRKKKVQSVMDKQIALIEEGEGDPILLHGNPTPSYLRRNVIPALAGSHFIQQDCPVEVGRAIAQWHKTI
ncbi:hypothetical protein N9X41_06175 [Porticoccaceae bacterium]|nr:hypothetical protein [Porticoccaceae bacterium]